MGVSIVIEIARGYVDPGQDYECEASVHSRTGLISGLLACVPVRRGVSRS